MFKGFKFFDLYDTIKRALKRAGLGDVRIHDFRATFASRLVQRGMSLQEVSILLGHTKATMTERYAALIPSDASKKAVDILKRTFWACSKHLVDVVI